MIIDGEDGVTHINIYSRGKTNIGRWLSNFTHAPIQTQDGHFNCIEGYWYWLTTKDERFRTLSGWECKSLGKESVDMVTMSEESFQEKIKSALDVKIKLKPREISKISLPLCHYYQYGDKKVDAGYEWIVEHFEKRIKQLKQHYGKS